MSLKTCSRLGITSWSTISFQAESVFCKIPYELILHVLSFLNLSDLNRISKTSRFFYFLSYDRYTLLGKINRFIFANPTKISKHSIFSLGGQNNSFLYKQTLQEGGQLICYDLNTSKERRLITNNLMPFIPSKLFLGGSHLYTVLSGSKPTFGVYNLSCWKKDLTPDVVFLKIPNEFSTEYWRPKDIQFEAENTLGTVAIAFQNKIHLFRGIQNISVITFKQDSNCLKKMILLENYLLALFKPSIDNSLTKQCLYSLEHGLQESSRIFDHEILEQILTSKYIVNITKPMENASSILRLSVRIYNRSFYLLHKIDIPILENEKIITEKNRCRGWVNENKIIFCLNHRAIFLLDIRTDKIKLLWKKSIKEVSLVAVNAYNNLLAIGTEKYIELFNIHTGYSLKKIYTQNRPENLHLYQNSSGDYVLCFSDLQKGKTEIIMYRYEKET